MLSNIVYRLLQQVKVSVEVAESNNFFGFLQNFIGCSVFSSVRGCSRSEFMS